MATLKSYGINTMFESGWGYESGDIQVGRNTYSLMRPLLPGESRPRMYRLAVLADASADDTSLTLHITDYADFGDTAGTATADAGVSVKLSKGDFLNFGSEATPVIAVIDESVVVTDAAAGVAVTVLPLIDPIGSTAGDTCFTYAMVTIDFAGTGGMFDVTSNVATASNKSTGYWELKATTSRSATVSLTGAMITSDYSTYLFGALNEGGRPCYYEIRYYPNIPFRYTDDTGIKTNGFGSGPEARKGTCTVNFKAMSDASEIIQNEVSLEAVGYPAPYVVLSNDSSEPASFTWA